MFEREGQSTAAFLREQLALSHLVPLPDTRSPAPDPQRGPGGLLTEAEAARKAGVSQKTIRRCIESGRLPVLDYGTGSKHLYRIEATALAALEAPAKLQPAAASIPQRRRPIRQVASSAAAYLPRV